MADPGIAGFGTLGYALSGGAEQEGANAYQSGMRVGAQTSDAIAQARDRIQKSQAANEAGDALETPALQEQLHITPEQGHFAAARARAGQDPKDVIAMVGESQKNNFARIAGDGTQTNKARLDAAMGYDPNNIIPKAEGVSGTFSSPLGYNPDAPPSPTNTPVHVSPEQVALNDATVEQKHATAAAATSNAASHAVTADASASRAATAGAVSGQKLLTGNKWVADPNDPTGVQHDSQGAPVQAPDLNANKGEGAVGERYTRRIVNATNGLAKETGVLSQIGLGASTEAQVNGVHNGVLGTMSQNMGKVFSTEQSQQYTSSLAGVANQLASLELAGGVPPGTYTQQLEQAVKNSPGDTPNTRLQHAALIRQISEVAAETADANPKMSAEAKQAIYTAVAKIQKNIPFTAGEVQDYRIHGKPGQTFQSFLDSSQREPAETYGGAAPAAVPARGAAPAAVPSSASDPLGILH